MFNNAQIAHHGSTVLECFRRRWPTMLLVAMPVFFASLYAASRLTPLYVSQTTLVLPYTPISELVNRNEIVGSPQPDPLIVHSYLQILKDDGICLSVIHQLNLAAKPEFDAPPNFASRLVAATLSRLFNDDGAAAGTALAREDRVLRLYKKRLTVDGGRSLAVDLSFESEDPRLAAAIVNAHAAAYLAAQVQYRRHETEIKATWMEEQVQHSADALRSAQVAVQLHQGSFRFGSIANANESADLKYLQAILSSKQSVYESLLNRQQVMLAEQRYSGSDTRILSPARPSARSAFPNKPLFGAVSAFVALLAGAGAAWGSDLVARRQRSTDDCLRELDLEQLATIEIPRRWSLSTGRLRRLRLAVYWEKIREVRSALTPWQEKGLVLAVTSAAPKQSTSLVATSLARAIAASGTPTLLLDLNLRQPAAHTFFDVTIGNRRGLQECLRGKLALDRVICQVGNCLSLLSGSSQGGENVDILAGPEVRAMLTKLRRRYSAIVIDTPSIGVVCDSLVVSDLADEVVLVANDEALDTAALRQAVWSLRRRSAAIRGVVLTKHRQASIQACRALGGFAVNDELSEVLPLPVIAGRRREVEAIPSPGVLQAAE